MTTRKKRFFFLISYFCGFNPSSANPPPAPHPAALRRQNFWPVFPSSLRAAVLGVHAEDINKREHRSYGLARSARASHHSVVKDSPAERPPEERRCDSAIRRRERYQYPGN